MLPQPHPESISLPLSAHFLMRFLYYFAVVPTRPLLFATTTIATTPQIHVVICSRPSHVAPPSKHDTSRIRKQEGSCPVMCVRISVAANRPGRCECDQHCQTDSACSQRSVLAFPVIYRCGATSHKASG